MRELTQAETATVMEQRKAVAMERLRAENDHFDMRDKNARVLGTAKRTMTMGMKPSPGYDLAILLQKAAGLEGFRLRSIECRISCKEAVTFTAEIYGTAEDIAAAIAANEEEAK